MWVIQIFSSETPSFEMPACTLLVKNLQLLNKNTALDVTVAINPKTYFILQ